MPKVEIYSKDWCPYCTKAKALLNSKGLSAAEINITSSAELERQMISRSGRRTVPQIFIDDQAFGGYDDIAQLNATGELDKILGISTDAVDVSKIYDLIIVGAGPAGITAAIYAIRKNLSILVISLDIGGQLGTTQEIGNYPGVSKSTGPELASKMAEHMDQYPVEKMIGEKVIGIDFLERNKVLKTASGKELITRSVIIATGAYKRKLNVPGEKKFAGKGIVYCSTCDGYLFRNMDVAVVGGGNSGLEAAIEMSMMANQVYLIARGELTGDEILKDKVAAAKNIQVMKQHAPVEVVGSEQVEGIVIENLDQQKQITLTVSGVFVEIGLYPNSDFLLDMMEANDRGEIKTDNRGHTGIRGVFAAGDVTDSHEKQVIVAAGSGANAALAAFEYLITQV